MLSLVDLKCYSLSILLLLLSCNNENPNPGGIPTGQSKTFSVNAVVNPTISGIITFIENSDNTTTIKVAMQNTVMSDNHPAYLHFNSVVETGGIALSLSPIDGSTGISTTTVNQLDNGTLMSYGDFLDFDGYLKVHLSFTEFETIIGQADVGSNELTGDFKSYELNSADIPIISGRAVFEKRRSGESLATITLQNTLPGGVHPAHIHANSVEEGGEILFTLNPIIGDTGLSITHIAKEENGKPLLYEDILLLNAHIKAHLSADDLQTVVFAENIGQN